MGGKVDVPTPGGTVTVTIPPRSQSGKRLRVKGQGARGATGTGDLYIELQIKLPDALSESNLEKLRSLETAYTQSVRHGITW
jgi:DnaJ-class molecular chaperone